MEVFFCARKVLLFWGEQKLKLKDTFQHLKEIVEESSQGSYTFKELKELSILGRTRKWKTEKKVG